ncbi:hypothetical protein Tco_1553777 [Tanacetum coccineum]
MAGVFNHWVVKFRGAKRPLDSCRNAAVNSKCEQDSAVIRTHSEQGSAVVWLGFSGQAYAARRRKWISNKKDRKQAKYDNMSNGMEMTVQNQGPKSKMPSQSQCNESAVSNQSQY